MTGENIAKMLGILIAEQGSYTYVDKLGYAQSLDLALFYLKEALRDFHSLSKKEFDNTKAKEEFNKLKLIEIDKEINEITKEVKENGKENKIKLREIISYTTAKALSYSMYLIKEGEKSA